MRLYTDMEREKNRNYALHWDDKNLEKLLNYPDNQTYYLDVVRASTFASHAEGSGFNSGYERRVWETLY